MIMVRYWRWWWGSAHLHLIILPYCLSSFSRCLDLERRKCSSPPHSFPPYFIFHADPFSFSNLGNGRNNGWGITRYRGARIWQATLVLGWLAFQPVFWVPAQRGALTQPWDDFWLKVPKAQPWTICMLQHVPCHLSIPGSLPLFKKQHELTLVWLNLVLVDGQNDFFYLLQPDPKHVEKKASWAVTETYKVYARNCCCKIPTLSSSVKRREILIGRSGFM